jgi:hypothetical protein
MKIARQPAAPPRFTRNPTSLHPKVWDFNRSEPGVYIFATFRSEPGLASLKF